MKQIVFDGQLYNVLDETPTHYVCPPESINEGYHFITKSKAKEADYYRAYAAQQLGIPYSAVTTQQRVKAKKSLLFKLYAGGSIK